jgi:fructokinase
MDLGGTKLEGVVLDPDGKEIFRKRVNTEIHLGYKALLERIRGLHEELARVIASTPHAIESAPGFTHTLGIGTPGAISARTGLLKNSNSTCLNGQPLHSDLQKILGRPLAVENDANCFAMAEGLMGAGRDRRVVFGVIMGTGCGGGIMIDGRVRTGLQRIGGEWGHMSIDPHGPVCYCGSRGCVETFVSGGGLQNRYFEKHGIRKAFPQIVAEYRSGDSSAAAFMSEFFDRFGRAIANLIAILDPDVIVLGGGLSEINELYTEGVEAVKKYIFSDSLETPILKNKLGDSAGVFGAALIGI